MLSARGRFAVPEKILNRSSFTTLALQRALVLGTHTSWPEIIFNGWLNRCFGDAADQPRTNGGHKKTLTSALHFTNVPVARECLANKGLIVRKPNSGSARLRWARENSKHRRTATRQRGFCSSAVEQSPLDLIKTGVTPENGRLEVIRKAASLRAPA